MTAVLEFKNFSLSLEDAQETLVHSFSLAIQPGERVALVGESGSGKSLLARAALGLLPDGIAAKSGEIVLNGKDLSACSATQIQQIRGSKIGLVFQEPLTALNPALMVGTQLRECLRFTACENKAEQYERCIGMLSDVQIRNPRQVLRSYPHQLSGGMRQRVMLAAVMLAEPELIIADEPTTALDVIVQQEIMQLLLSLSEDLGSALMLITHDLALVAENTQRIAVLEQGHLRETGDSQTVISAPSHSYTQRLIKAANRQVAPLPITTENKTLLSVNNLNITFPRKSHSLWRRKSTVKAVRNVSFELEKGKTTTIIGESGSGKTTIARTLMGLQKASSGQVLLEGKNLGEYNRIHLSSRVQYIFQDPFASLDPRFDVEQLVSEGLLKLPLSKRERKLRTFRALEDVGLGPEFRHRLPHQLSGGQRQRVGIARAIAQRPKLIIADEPVAALDVSLQAQVLSLFRQLQSDYGFTYLFISHDIGMVKSVSHNVMVMLNGSLIEHANCEQFFRQPLHPYSCKLLNATPQLEPHKRELFEARALPAGLCYLSPNTSISNDTIQWHSEGSSRVAVTQQDAIGLDYASKT